MDIRRFIFAVRNNDLQLVKYLLKHGADPYLLNGDRLSPYGYAAEKGLKEIQEFFLTTEKYDINTEYEEGYTQLHYAAEKGHHRATNAFLGLAPAFPNAETDEKLTPFFLSLQEI